VGVDCLLIASLDATIQLEFRLDFENPSGLVKVEVDFVMGPDPKVLLKGSEMGPGSVRPDQKVTPIRTA